MIGSALTHDTHRGSGLCLQRLVRHRAEADPNATAVVDGAVRLSYQLLDRAANAVGLALLDRGIVAGDRVAITVSRSAEFVVAALGVLKAGAAYVPIDPDYPAARRRFMVADSVTRAVITAGAAGPPVADVGAPPTLRLQSIVDLRARRIRVEDLPADPPPGVDHPGLPAYLIYTSGSTGTPKGALIGQAEVVQLLTADPRLTMRPGQSMAHLAPTAFDASTFEIWAPLVAGGRIEVMADRRPSAAELASWLRRVRPDWMFLTSGLFQQLVDADPDALRCIGVLISGGDLMSDRHVRTAAGLVRDRFYAAYGPTETTVFASLHEVTAVPRDRRDPVGGTAGQVPLGTALTGRVMRVLGPDLEPCRPGEPGEIYLGGAGLAHGYHGRPALTAERFLPDPHAAVPGSRMYRTGDLARMTPAEDVYFTGRVDRQVKLRGFRIELAEIEAALTAHPDVAAAAAVVVAEASGRRLVCYVAPVGRRDLESAALRSWLAARLPEHMMPANYVLLDRLPLDPNGKLDRSALPTPWTRRADLSGRDLPAFEPARSPVQRLIAEAFVDALDIDEVGVHDNFFLLGGDSLRSVRTLGQLRGQGMRFSSRDFFGNPTVAGLAGLVEATAEPATAGR